MKAQIRVEVLCGECNGQMQYHQEGKFVRCNTIKCSQRHVNYLAPTIQLEKEEKANANNSNNAGKTPASKSTGKAKSTKN